MKLRIKGMKNIVILLFIIVAALSAVKIVNASCDDAETFNLKIYDPDIVEIQTCGTQTLYTSADTESCPTSPVSCGDQVICQKVGTYTAQIDYGGGTHSAVSSENVITCYALSPITFVIRNGSGAPVAAFDAKGDLYIRGKNSTNAASPISPPPGSFIIQNSTGQNVSYIDSAGNLVLTGNFIENIATSDLNPDGSSLIIRNSTGTDLAYMNDTGNLALSGWIHEQWLDPLA